MDARQPENKLPMGIIFEQLFSTNLFLFSTFQFELILNIGP